MKVEGISVGNQHPVDKRTLDEFALSPGAETPLGKLLIALAHEETWSSEYEVNAHLFGHDPTLFIQHKHFPSGRPLEVSANGTISLSVRGVEDAVRAHIIAVQDGLRPAIDMIQSSVNNLQRTMEQILWDKAKASIVSAFPKAGSLEPAYAGTIRDLYPFDVRSFQSPIYIARKVGYDFAGVARIQLNSTQWYQLGDGCGERQKYGVFFGALALAFVAREFGIPEEVLRVQHVTATKLPWEKSQIDQFVAESVALTCTDGAEFIVLFGESNLPEKGAVTKHPDIVMDRNMLFIR